MGEQTDDLEWVTLVSNDGYEFVIHKSAALVSGMIRKSLDPKGTFFLFSFLCILFFPP